MTELLALFLFLVLPGYYIYRKLKKLKKSQKWSALPKDGPMKVNIKEEAIPSSAFNSKLFKCRMIVDVTVSQRDWKAIADAGLLEYTLFEWPTPDGKDMWPFKVKDLERKREPVFMSQIQMADAKEKLIEGLQNLRSQIDYQREGPKSETIEI